MSEQPPGLTAEEFAAWYVSGRETMTVEKLLGYGREPRPCGCDEVPGVHWIMTNAADYDDDLELFRQGRGYDPSHGAPAL